MLEEKASVIQKIGDIFFILYYFCQILLYMSPLLTPLPLREFTDTLNPKLTLSAC
jgi:hypothetical protein